MGSLQARETVEGCSHPGGLPGAGAGGRALQTGEAQKLVWTRADSFQEWGRGEGRGGRGKKCEVENWVGTDGVPNIEERS